MEQASAVHVKEKVTLAHLRSMSNVTHAMVIVHANIVKEQEYAQPAMEQDTAK